MSIKKDIEELLKEVREDKYRQYADEWQARAVAVLNEWNLDERKDWDAYIYDANGEEFEDMVRGQLEARGWCGLKFFLQGVSNTADWVRLDGYGNGEEITGAELFGLLMDARDEVED